MNPTSSLEAHCPLKATKVVGIAADHGGHELKEYLAGMLRAADAEVIDFGAHQRVPEDDYPDFVVPLARAVAAGQVERGVAICGSGVGACVVANKVRGVRACLIHDPFSAHQGVEDDDLNMICLGGFVVGQALAWELVRIFLCARFSGNERHRRRLAKVMDLENQSLPKSINTSHKAGGTIASAKSDPGENVSSHTSLKLYLIRHGETEWSRSGQYTGSTDIPLTAHGESAARDVGERLRNISFAHVLVSPLQRAQQTCALAGLKPAPSDLIDLKRRALDRWENEGGKVPVEHREPAATSRAGSAHEDAEPIFET